MRLAASSRGRGRLRILRWRRRVPSSRIYASIIITINIPGASSRGRLLDGRLLGPRHPRRLRRPVHPFPQRLVVHAEPQHPREHAPEKRDGLAQRPPEQRIIGGLRVERVEERAGARDAAAPPGASAGANGTGDVDAGTRPKTRRRRRRRRRGALRRGRRREHRAEISGAQRGHRDGILPEIEEIHASLGLRIRFVWRQGHGFALIGSYLRGKSSGCGCEPRKSYPRVPKFYPRRDKT